MVWICSIDGLSKRSRCWPLFVAWRRRRRTRFGSDEKMNGGGQLTKGPVRFNAADKTSLGKNGK